jgi:predicted negative regulator of RcsB-dependent stress response
MKHRKKQADRYLETLASIDRKQQKSLRKLIKGDVQVEKG